MTRARLRDRGAEVGDSSARRAIRPRPASTGSSCTAPMATCSRRSSLLAHQSAHLDEYGACSPIACAIRRGLRSSTARSGRAPPIPRISSIDRASMARGRLPGHRGRDRGIFKACSPRPDRLLVGPVEQAACSVPVARCTRRCRSIGNEAEGLDHRRRRDLEADHVNSIIAGCVDLVRRRPAALANPAWTLLYLARIATPRSRVEAVLLGKTQLERNLERERADGGGKDEGLGDRERNSRLRSA